MQIEALCCCKCGAPLEVPVEVHYLTCRFCSSRLEVQRTDSALYTTLLEHLDREVQRISSDVDELKLEAELERIDREWDEEKGRILRRTPRGEVIVPRELEMKLALGLAWGIAIIVSSIAIALQGGIQTTFMVSVSLIGAAFVTVMISLDRNTLIRYRRALSRWESLRQEAIDRYRGS